MTDKNNDLETKAGLPGEPPAVELPVHLKDITEPIISMMLANVETDEMLMPVAYLHNTSSKEAAFCALDLCEDPDGRERIFRSVRKVASEMDADVSITIVESYMRRVGPDESVDKVYDENGGKLMNDPKAIEVVVVSIETPTKTFMGMSKINKNSATPSGRSATPPEFRDVRLEGRLANVIIKQELH